MHMNGHVKLLSRKVEIHVPMIPPDGVPSLLFDDACDEILEDPSFLASVKAAMEEAAAKIQKSLDLRLEHRIGAEAKVKVIVAEDCAG